MFWLWRFGVCAFQTVLWFELFCSVVVVGLVAGVLLFVFGCRGFVDLFGCGVCCLFGLAFV